MATGIVILNYNSYQDTINCIQSVELHNSAPVKYIIVDNGSSDKQSVPALKQFLESSFPGRYLQTTEPAGILPYVTLVASPTNDGYARGNNKGLRLAFDDSEISHILILNNDILLTEDIIPPMMSALKELPQCGMVSPLLYRKDRKTMDFNCARRNASNFDIILPFLFQNRNFFQVLSKIRWKNKMLLDDPSLIQSKAFVIDLPSGSCMFLEKELFQKMGGFDPNTFLYYEECILFKKTEALHLKNYCIPSLSAIHLGAHTTQMSSNKFLQKCNLDSADYYLRQYGKMTFLEKCVWGLAKWGYATRLRLTDRNRKS